MGKTYIHGVVKGEAMDMPRREEREWFCLKTCVV